MRMKMILSALVIALAANMGDIALADNGLTNIAIGKKITAGNYSGTLPKINLIDGNYSTYVDETGNLTDNENGVAADYTKGENRYEIDLGALYPVNSIKLFDNAGNWYSEYDFKISAAVSADFSDAVTLFETEDFVPQTLPLEISCNEEFYRYIRLERVNSGMAMGYTYSELEIWADESAKVEDSQESKEPVNVALNKPVTSGMWRTDAPKENINDGKSGTFVWPNGDKTDNADGVPSIPADNWYIFDLEARYKIDYIKLIDNTNTWTSAYNVKILASNDKNFENDVYEIVNSGADKAIALGEKIACGSDEYYRYVKIQKFPGVTQAGYQYSEFEVYSANELKINVTAETEPDKIVLKFDRDVAFNNIRDVTAVLASKDENLAFKSETRDERTFVLNFDREIYSDEVIVRLPDDFSEDVQLGTYEIKAKFKDVISPESVVFVDGNGAEIFQLTDGGSKGAKIMLKNSSNGVSGNCVVLTMTYNGKKLVGITEDRVMLNPGESREIKTEVQTADGDKYRVWIFKDYKTISEIYKGEIVK